jgi:hypothetical protein
MNLDEKKCSINGIIAAAQECVGKTRKNTVRKYNTNVECNLMSQNQDIQKMDTT